MRLTQIKLAGFKSFVDPTVIPTPSQLVGVVGPNGCGKSNIIDAVRWVLGETRATELRGESMQDVIFSGSGDRKPAGRASVELVFDNSAGRAAGQWSVFSEISVRRVLTRDGTSSYFVNNQQVRRRDVHDIFLGTGLGSRGYAIIGQGMISRLIEARPEELRVYLEEAAGVSRYKERRRETENRLHDTRENLTRVEDILRELNSQLEKLEQQAVVAGQYRELQEEGQLKQHALWFLREQAAHEEKARLAQKTEQAEQALEEAIARLRQAESDLETRRQAHYAASDAVHQAQGKLYEANAKVSSLEAEIRHIVDARNRIQSRQSQLTTQTEEWAAQIEHCTAQLDIERQALETQAAQLEEAQLAAQAAQAELPDIEQRVREAAAQREQMRSALAKIEQELALVAQRRGDAERQLQVLAQRRERLQQERRDAAVPDEEALVRLKGDKQAADQQLEQAHAALTDLEAALPEADQARAQAREQLQKESTQLSNLEARLAALVALQEDVQKSGTLEPWLASHELAQLPRLWQKLQIQPGWEAALEAVLNERMVGVEVSNLSWTQAFANDAPPARLAFYQMPVPAASGSDASSLKPLLSLVQTSDPALRTLLSQWLGHVYVADSVSDAIARRDQLPSGGMWVVREGHLVDTSSVRFYAPDSEQAGMLARQQEIENLQREIKAQQMLADQARTAATRSEVAWQQASEAVVPARQRVSELTQRAHDLQLSVARLQQETEQRQERSARLDEDLGDLDAQIETLSAESETSEARFGELDEQLAEQQSVYAELEMQGETIASQAQAVRDRVRDRERAEQEGVFAERGTRARIAELERNLQLATDQQTRAAQEADSLVHELATLDAATPQNGLQEALEIRAEHEEVLGRLRIEMDTLAAQLREADEARLTLERSLEPQREAITQLQLQDQAARLSAEQFAEQLDEHQVDREQLKIQIEQRSQDDERGDWHKIGWLQGEVQRINRQIESLGAVNLAALEELNSSRERKVFLESQYNDLNEAIETLEDAIRKIDRETRELLQTTFNEVNGHFGELFPKLFGGGEAKLVMTGEEILDAGVQVMAQPPGKRNSTIHLLSGGEKALTATALVFALFKLNPAPFCLLDEVDAPLDDANTERYANLVSGMSDATQFLFISHNKIAMQMAKHLIGVTMQEQGVSRIVAVDIDSAIQLAAEAA
ncbi:chromosome segregation protein SMC [Orrella daihaiensis]|uniref:Chromosome partition protein Smc n=1 Tax=Orrella daihaiensis TaxID=2782176 RepID=A0ABY4AHR0_9BURK|nr:chromosome segregation protein SMC [Orrella daihaiensis]UOD49828.1 chromosome segregation protein SMC [Orrella daihaiensis]